MENKVNDKYLDLSNAELRVKILTMEHEYEALKTKIKECIERMEVLDEEYTSMKNILNKRTKGLG